MRDLLRYIAIRLLLLFGPVRVTLDPVAGGGLWYAVPGDHQVRLGFIRLVSGENLRHHSQARPSRLRLGWGVWE